VSGYAICQRNRRTIFVVGPKELPIGGGNEINSQRTCWLREFQIVNSSSGTLTVSISDSQAPPIMLVPSTSLPPGGMISGNFALGRLMPGGIIWSASGSGAHGFIAGEFE
jgi:hypothetical protein